MLIVKSVTGVPVRLTTERWDHISTRHPEMQTQKEQVLETVQFPDLVQRGDFGELLAVRHYPSTPLTKKYLIVVYREVSQEDGFVLTAYLTNRPAGRRETIWKR